MVYIPEDQIWVVIVGFLLAFVLAFGLGANDVANTFGSSVGSGVLTLKQACILATICEISGALLLGSKVSSTVRKGITDIGMFANLENGPKTLMLGQLAALGGSCSWLIFATFFRLPVSGTHSIVGATMGFSLVLFGVNGIQWIGVAKIVASWFISPILSGAVSVGIFVIIHYLVLVKPEHLEPALRLLPGFYGSIILVNLVSIFLAGSDLFKFSRIPLYGVFILSCGGGIIVVICVKHFLLPYLRNRILAGDKAGPSISSRLYRACQCHRVSNIWYKCKRIWKSDGIRTVEEQEQADPEVTRDNITSLPDIGFASAGKVVTVPENDNLEMTNQSDWKSQNGNYDSQTIAPSVNRSGTRAFEVTPTDAISRLNQNNGSSIRSSSAHQNEHSSTHVSMTKRTCLAQPCLPAIGEEDSDPRESIKDSPHAAQVFWFLQILTAVFGSFAHGGNDVSNAIGPVMGLWTTYISQDVETKLPNPYWILLYGGIGISVGLCVWGRRVIQTLGEDLTRITPTSGVCIEIGSAFTVLFASKLGLPVSTTHCQVGSVIFVGRFRSRDNVNWSIFRNIIIAWVVTVPAACGISALFMYLLLFTL